MGIITIKSRKEGFFDGAPVCGIYVDNRHIGDIIAGRKVSFKVDEGKHSIYCAYKYAKYNIEKTNDFIVSDGKNYNLVLGLVYSKTYMGRFKENIRTLASKGYMNVPDIELYED